jgi:EAL domain-containing protein (putative c-di-GMP-specific phosphodiesterase class I)
VETSEQVALLKELHCRYAQGFYFSRPLTARQAEELLLGHPSIVSTSNP